MANDTPANTNVLLSILMGAVLASEDVSAIDQSYWLTA